MNISDILEDRESTHGAFVDVAETTNSLMAIVRDRRADLHPDQLEALHMICLKVARIVCGNPHGLDHWQDIAGYSTLIVRRLEKELMA